MFVVQILKAPMQRLVLTTNGISMSELEDLFYDAETGAVSFKYKTRTYRVAVEDSMGSYIKVFENGELEILNKVAHCHNC